MANFVVRDLGPFSVSRKFAVASSLSYGDEDIDTDITDTDISNKEQLTICIRWVDEQLEAHEDFFGFYDIPDIGAETLVSAVKDVLLKLQLPLANCRGQCYEGASNMLGHRAGVAKRIQDLQLKAYPWVDEQLEAHEDFFGFYNIPDIGAETI